ncbi:hypothetical protein C7974DRAFT_27710 [Boeremia exigua]|uniref:uncharacterized protein n=1 Tax=Boeremia exigua TaxID=749465 RepID=UPI001E8EB840|nr:uncharacterized protein C7974DRAFT_27710 [Boeremia exigua]KAH6644786.1 hypothetical protein C7974DRAFT_27710 [Boeremia exigua]
MFCVVLVGPAEWSRALPRSMAVARRFIVKWILWSTLVLDPFSKIVGLRKALFLGPSIQWWTPEIRVCFGEV